MVSNIISKYGTKISNKFEHTTAENIPAWKLKMAIG